LVVNKALGCATPVITNNEVCGAADLVHPDDTGLLYRIGDSDGLAQATAHILNEDGLGERLAKNAKVRMKTWSLEQTTPEILRAAQTVTR
jgi:glycosyltransferase involved in cell wall biosynthesis